MSPPTEAQDQSNIEDRKFNAEMAFEHRRLDLEERKLAQDVGAKKLTILSVAVPALSSLFGALVAVFVTAQNNVDIKDLDVREALEVQEKSAELELERQIRQQRFEIIVQATQGNKRDIASENLLFFVEAGILTDPDGKIRTLAERGAAPEFGTVPRVNDLRTSDAGISFLKRFIELNLTKVRNSDGRSVIGYNHWASDPFVTLENGAILDLTRDEITIGQAEALLRHDLSEVEDSINANVNVRLSQAQFDTLVSFVSDVGPRAFEASEIVPALNTKQFGKVPDLMMNWKNVSNLPVPKVVERRSIEIARWIHASK